VRLSSFSIIIIQFKKKRKISCTGTINEGLNKKARFTDPLNKGLNKASVASKTQSMWKKVKSWFVSSPGRVFLKTHQFFGCSHLMAVRDFMIIYDSTFIDFYIWKMFDFILNNFIKLSISKYQSVLIKIITLFMGGTN